MEQNMPPVDIAEEMAPILALRKRTLKGMAKLSPTARRWFAESLIVHPDETRDVSDVKH